MPSRGSKKYTPIGGVRSHTLSDYKEFNDPTHDPELTGDLTKCSDDEIAKSHIQPAVLNEHVNRHLAKFVPGLKALSNSAFLPHITLGLKKGFAEIYEMAWFFLCLLKIEDYQVLTRCLNIRGQNSSLAQQLLDKHPGKPLAAFWYALSDQRQGVAMAVVSDPRCGIERKAKGEFSTHVGRGFLYFNFNRGGGTPLIFAAIAGRTDVMIDLLAAGADATATDLDRNFTALHVVRSVEAVRILIANGCDVNARDSNGDTPLNCLCTKETDIEAIELLFAKGADVRVLNKQLQNPLHVAIGQLELPSIQVFRLLIEKGCDIESGCVMDPYGGPMGKSDGNTPLHLAATKPCTEIAKLLVSEGAGLNYLTSSAFPQTPLCSAVQQDNLELMRYLLDAGSDMTAKGYKGSPLHFASLLTTIEMLVAEGADVNEPDAFGDTPLHWVPLRSSRDYGGLLISKGARVNAVNAKGQSPLHVAAEKGRLDTIRMLLEHGADVNLEDGNGRTAHEVFCRLANIPLYLDLSERRLRHMSPPQKQMAKDLLKPSKKKLVCHLLNYRLTAIWIVNGETRIKLLLMVLLVAAYLFRP